MPLNKVYRKSSELLSNFDFIDIARGVAIEKFYGGVYFNGTVSAAILSNQTFYSEPIVTRQDTITTNASTLHIERDFDMDFLLPRHISGAVLVNVPMGVKQDVSVTESYQISAAIVLKRIRGTDTTIIGSQQTFKMDEQLINQVTKSRMFAVKIDADEKFKKGDIFRMNIKMYGAMGGSGRADFGMGHDPLNRNEDNTNPTIEDDQDTTLTILMPFKIDV